MAISSIPQLDLAARLLAPLPYPLLSRKQDAGPESIVQQARFRLAEPSLSVPAPATGQQLLTSLEQALFRDLLGNVQPDELTALTPDLEQFLAGPSSAGPGANFMPVALQTDVATSMPLASLFAAVQLLGGAAGQEQTSGSLLDVFA